MSPAKESAGTGTKGGTLVAACRGPGLADIDMPEDPREAVEERITANLWGGVVKGGVLVISVYMWHSEGLSSRNRHLLQVIGEIIRYYDRPYILAGDWNMSPEELMAWEGWQSLQGVAVAPGEATMVLGEKESLLDFFVIREVLRPLLGRVYVDHRFATRPHRAVAMEIGGWQVHPVGQVPYDPGQLRCRLASARLATGRPGLGAGGGRGRYGSRGWRPVDRGPGIQGGDGDRRDGAGEPAGASRSGGEEIEGKGGGDQVEVASP